MSIFNPIGSAMANPVALEGGSSVITTGSNLIKESILDIIGTTQGETLFNESYGSRLQEALFQPNDTITFSIIKQFVIEAIEVWEKRVKINDVTVSASTNSKIKCNISITVTILATNLKESFVYPFYEKLN